jgi:hypothetical protein
VPLILKLGFIVPASGGNNVRYLLVLVLAPVLVCPALAEQNPYFVTYDHRMEEPRNLEISIQSTVGSPRRNLPGYLGQLLELEYGMTGWWSSALYFEGAAQRGDSVVFTGFRLENRFKPLKGEHAINPVLYLEYENVNEASRIDKEIVGHAEPSSEPLSELRGETAREIEGKLILSSYVRSFNIAENFIIERSLTENEGFEFGYAVGIFRPLSSLVSGKGCRLCRENFSAGLELYGGLGSTERFGLPETAHYLAPAVLWNVGGHTFKISPAFGLTHESGRMLFRFGYTYEISDFGRKVSQMFGVARR